MKKLKSSPVFKHAVLVFLITYLCGSFINMLSIPRYNYLNAKAFFVTGFGFNRLVKKANIRKTNFLQVIDKSTFDNDQQETFNLAAKSFLLIFLVCSLPNIKLRLTWPQFTTFYNFRYAYLSFCTFRI